MNLRDALLQGLASLPGTRRFHVHVLVSVPRRHSNLFPYAAPRPKTFLQDILVLLSEQADPDSPRVFVSAIEACLYHLPSTSSAVLYVSKVDSTGQAKAPSPTPALVRAFLAYHVEPTTRPLPVGRLWVHLFARAQNQYLFPNSAEFAGKRPLTDIKLCAWWKRQLGIVAHDVATRVGGQGQGDVCVRLHYLLPGLGELEASHALERVYGATSTTSVPWSYGHPYSQTEVPLPCLPMGRGEKLGHIGHEIPWFDDDPKARFLDEIAYTTEAEGVKSPERKRARTHRGTQGQRSEEEGESGTERKEGTTLEQTTKALRRVSAEEFWERMSFRQECIAGAVTGFFVMATSCATPTARSEGSPLAPLPGQVSSRMMKRVLSSLMTGHEFPSVERAAWSTRVLEETIEGLCDGVERAPEREETTGAPGTPRPGSRRRTTEDVSGEAVATAETYRSHIYGSVAVSNAEEPRQEAAETSGVTVLTARRKKRGKP